MQHPIGYSCLICFRLEFLLRDARWFVFIFQLVMRNMNAKNVDQGLNSSSDSEHDHTLLGVGERIRHVRTEVIGLAQKALATQMGVGLSTLQRYESGERDADLSFVVALGKLAGVQVAWLVSGEGEMRTPSTQSPSHEEAPAVTKEVPISEAAIASLLPHGVPDMDMLQALLEGIYRWEERVGVRLQPARKAAMATLLYKYFESEGKVDSEKLDALLSRAA